MISVSAVVRGILGGVVAGWVVVILSPVLICGLVCDALVAVAREIAIRRLRASSIVSREPTIS